MKSLLSILILLIGSAATALASDPNSENTTDRRERNCIKHGNEAYRAGDYAKAEEWYKEALQYNPTSTLSLFNLALTVERQHPTTKAEKNQQPEGTAATGNANAVDDLYGSPKALFSKVTEISRDNNLRQASFYNLGNIAFNETDYAAAIEYYKEALRIDESNMKTRQNLRIAQLKLQQQQDQQQNQDQNQQQQEDQEQQNQDQQQQQDQQDQQQQENQDQQQQQSQPQQQTNGNQTKQNAEQILEAARKQEAQTRKDVERRQNSRSTRTVVDKPW
ncbi:MAG: tetratricopeptide repeat protein [Paramuribaculum sp.]|nr:tetratricopeptide repeat protein [Paramuribaculum sp.]